MDHWKKYITYNTKAEDVNKISDVQCNSPPGPINEANLSNLCINNKSGTNFVSFCDDFMNNLILKPGLKENKDYAILSDKEFEYLYNIYGGTDIRRFTIPVHYKSNKRNAIF